MTASSLSLVDNPVQRPAPSAERKPFSVVEKRFTASTADTVLKDADAFLKSREALDPAWLMDIRQDALAFLKQRGLPTARLERWKYTSLRGLDALWSTAPIQQSSATTVTRDDLPSAYSPLRAVFVDGVFQSSLSDMPEGIEICGSWRDHMDAMQNAWDDTSLTAFNDQMQWALNSLYAADGLIINLPKSMILEHPLEVLSIKKMPQVLMPRHAITLGDNAQMTIIEHNVDMTGNDDAAQFINGVTMIKIGNNAHLKHHKLQNNGAEDMILESTHLTQQRDSTYKAYNVSAGLETVNRQQVWVQIQGENSDCTLNGVQLSKGHQQLETAILMDHEAPHCTSNQDYRHIATEQSACHFQGKVHVHQIAQKTEAFQMSRGVVLSNNAEVNTKPELEIYADDVKCSHGATTGQIDEQALFYMRSRGLNEQEARKMLLTSFVAEVFGDLDEESPMAQAHTQIVTSWLKEVLS